MDPNAPPKEHPTITSDPTLFAPSKYPKKKDDAADAKKADGFGGRWGDVAFSFVERFGRIQVPSDSERGKSGNLQGSGVELRFMMRGGAGAYYRWSNAATNDKKGQDWYHLEYAFGFSKRLHSTGTSRLFALRTSSHFDVGFIYYQLGTNEFCSRSYAPLGTDCGTSNYVPGNASGAGVGMELRVGADVAWGPFDLGLDLGVSGYRRWSTGDGSVSIPGWWYIPSGQLKLAIALPFT